MTRKGKALRAAGGRKEGKERVRPVQGRSQPASKSLFSQHYLANRIEEHGEWAEDGAKPLTSLQALYWDKKAILPSLNEAQTEEEFIREALKILGFQYIPQTSVRVAGRVQRPDYALFADERAKADAYAVQSEEPAFYARALAVCDAKYWGRPLSQMRLDDPRDDFKNTNPSFQIVNYLIGTGVDWGILTNGAVWRLYYRQASSTATEFYEVHLVDLLEADDHEAFKYFWLFFRRDALVDDAQGRNFLKRVLEGSATYARVVGDRLKGLVFEEVFPLLSGGFVSDAVGRGEDVMSEDARALIYESALSLLYKVLFLLYAEARNLLPMDNPGYRAQSLTKVACEVAGRLDREEPLGRTSTGIYDRLLNLCRMLDRGDQNVGLPRYNGGLFHFDFSEPAERDRHRGNWYLTQHKVPDEPLARALDRLARIDGEPIDYGFIGVRHLGAIYEGLLEHRLVVDDAARGAVHLETDKGERKTTGSYYTPDHVVKYIVHETLRPILNQRAERFGELMGQIARVRKQLGDARRGSDSIRTLRVKLGQLEHQARETLLDIKICDPAMGSGHFLVEAVDFLTDGLIDVLNRYPEHNPVLAALDCIRQDILASLSDQDIPRHRGRLDDTQLLQRVVMKRCIYGVDLNRMAVELAKVSLWLHSFTVGAPLSFLDHHLRRGNSLMGATAREAQEQLTGEMPMFGGPFAGLLRAAEIMRGISLLSNATFAEAEESGRLFKEFDEAAGAYKQLLDIYVARYFSMERAGEFLRLYGVDAIQAGPDSVGQPYRTLLRVVRQLYEDKRFFHWDLEFPEVFIDLDRATWKQNPGFDAVVGNPPYVFIVSVPREDRNYYFQAFSTCQYRFDVYGLFVDRGLSVCARGGQLGYIIPHSMLNNNSFERLRTAIIDQASHIQVIDFTDKVFPAASNEPMILLARLRSDYDQDGPVLKAARSASDDLSTVDNRLRQYSASLVERLPGRPFIVGGGDWLQRMLERPDTEPLGSIVRVTQGLRTGDNTRFLTPNPSGPLYRRALAGSDLYRYGFEWPGTYVLYDRGLLDAPRDEIFWEAAQKILVQEVRNVRLPRRIVGALDVDRFIGLNSTNVILLRPEATVSLYYIMALISSKLVNEFFRACFVDNHIATQYLESIPTIGIALRTPAVERQRLSERARALYSSAEHCSLLAFVDERLAGEPAQADVIHDLLAYLAQQMIDMNKQKQAESNGFLRWLGDYTRLAIEDWRLKTIVQAYWEHRWDELLRAMWENSSGIEAASGRNVEGRETWEAIKGEFEQSMSRLEPLLDRIAATDRLIDLIVYRLYGLTEEEVAIVEQGLGCQR